jgi:hypothetical protein
MTVCRLDSRESQDLWFNVSCVRRELKRGATLSVGACGAGGLLDMKPHATTFAVVLMLAALWAPGLAQAQYEGPTVPQADQPDPNTGYGQSVQQNQYYQQQEQQNEQQDRQNQQQLQDQQQQLNQYNNNQQQNGQPDYSQQSAAPAASAGGYGAIYVGARDPRVFYYSYNFNSAVAARAYAKGRCFGETGADCKLALELANTCGALAISPKGVWAARTDPLFPKAMIDASDACKRASGQDCEVKAAFCVPK